MKGRLKLLLLLSLMAISLYLNNEGLIQNNLNKTNEISLIKANEKVYQAKLEAIKTNKIMSKEDKIKLNLAIILMYGSLNFSALYKYILNEKAN